MRKILTSILILLWTSIAFAQLEEPVKWTSHTEKISDTEYDLVFKQLLKKIGIYTRNTIQMVPLYLSNLIVIKKMICLLLKEKQKKAQPKLPLPKHGEKTKFIFRIMPC